MPLKHTHKIAVIGIGQVGSSVCYGLINQGICDELVLVDRYNEAKAQGEAMDLRHSIEYMSRNMKVYAGDYSDCGDADIAIFTLGTSQASLKKDERGLVVRSSSLEAACKMIKPVVKSLMDSGFDGYIVSVTNPLDTITRLIWKLSGLSSNQVIGTGTALDSARLKLFLGELMSVDPHNINAYVIGEHGPSQFVPWSIASVGGKSMEQIKADNPQLFVNVTYDDIQERVHSAGPQVVNLKGYTSCGIASAAIAIARAILFNENRVIPVCTNLDGHFGFTDVFTSVPAIIDSDGVREIIDLHLTPEEMEQFRHTVDVIKAQDAEATKFV